MALKPPRHSVDAPVVFIQDDDPAWDIDRIEREKDEMRQAGEDPERHPVDVYFSGENRFDLHAPQRVLGADRCPADYLDESKAPIRFKIKRLSFDQFYEIQGLVSREDPQAWPRACQYGLQAIEPCPSFIPFKRIGGQVSSKTMQALFDSDPASVPAIGLASFLASMPLTEAEGK